jgi:hypothetical protein
MFQVIEGGRRAGDPVVETRIQRYRLEGTPIGWIYAYARANGLRPTIDTERMEWILRPMPELVCVDGRRVA